MGKCILAQGSKLIHHVTKVESAKEDRISFIISMVPRNAYHPEVTVFHTMKHLDTNSPTGIAPYEFFRSKTWHCRVSRIQNWNHFEENNFEFLFEEILDDYCKTEEFTTDKNKLSSKVNRTSWLMSHESRKSSIHIFFKLRAVAEELIRTADLIDGNISDKIGFFAEKGDKGSIWLEKDWQGPCPIIFW